LQSLEILRRLPLFVNLSCPIIAGMSRKRFIGEMTGIVVPEERDTASAIAGAFALSHGATILRVHNVAATVSAVRIWQALQCPAAPKTGE
ncbi:MAG: dihydropteroate synthase, partial [Pseudomonadota bacterium]|nr:dihydropteroate synthase [Pseudomonadota bacterium]